MGYRKGMFPLAVGQCIFLLYLSCYNCLQYERIKCTNTNDIDAFIYGLNYNPDVILAYPIDEATNYVSKEGFFGEKEKYIVLDRVKKNVSGSNGDIFVISSIIPKTFPGNLLLANRALVDNNPQILNVGRKPIKYRVNLPGLTDSGSFTIVPDFSSYQKSLNEVLNDWFDNYPNYDVTLQITYQNSMAYSKQQLKTALGIDVSGFGFKLDAEISNMNRRTESNMIFTCKQIFYTVSVEPPKKPSDLFNHEVTPELLILKGVNNSNPPVLVASASYGRLIFVKMKSHSTDNEVETRLTRQASLFGFSGGNTAKVGVATASDDFQMDVSIIGGGTGQAPLLNQQTPKDIKKIISETCKFKKNNLGFLLSYSSEFIRTNQQALVTGVTSYTETIRSEFKKGMIIIKQNGGFVARFTVHWDEFSVDKSGKEIRKRKSWGENGHSKAIDWDTEINLRGNCRNISFKAEIMSAVFTWSTFFERTDIPLIPKREFEIWGTLFKKRYGIKPAINRDPNSVEDIETN